MKKRPILTAILVTMGLLSLLVLWRGLHPSDPYAEMMRGMEEGFLRMGGVRVPGGWNFPNPSNSISPVDAALAAVLQPEPFAALTNIVLVEKPRLVTETEFVETDPDPKETERRRIESMTLVDDRKKEANEPNRVGGSE